MILCLIFFLRTLLFLSLLIFSSPYFIFLLIVLFFSGYPLFLFLGFFFGNLVKSIKLKQSRATFWGSLFVVLYLLIFTLVWYSLILNGLWLDKPLTMWLDKGLFLFATLSWCTIMFLMLKQKANNLTIAKLLVGTGSLVFVLAMVLYFNNFGSDTLWAVNWDNFYKIFRAIIKSTKYYWMFFVVSYFLSNQTKNASALLIKYISLIVIVSLPFSYLINFF